MTGEASTSALLGPPAPGLAGGAECADCSQREQTDPAEGMSFRGNQEDRGGALSSSGLQASGGACGLAHKATCN